VVSLLELQAENLNNEALSAIQLSQNRIYTISLIHQKLYKGENVASINIKEYLFELSQHLREVYGVDRKVDFDINIAPLDLDVSQAIPIGLIVNEAVTNSIKHGFEKAVRNLKISILLHQHAHDQVELKIADNGKGLPQAFDDTKVGGLGFKLIRALVDDLEGKISITSEKGTSLMIQFSKRASLDVNPGPSRQLQAQTT
jgi:two-component sensor histidine kinase